MSTTQQLIKTGTGSPIINVVLTPDQLERVPEIVGNYSVATVRGDQLVTFGQQPISAFSQQLDTMLDQITKADSPVLFELFRQISTGVKAMDLPKLEAEIRAQLELGWWGRLLQILHIQDRTVQLEAAAEQVRALLQGKATSLRDLVQPMERQITTESAKLIREINLLGEQARVYRTNIIELGVYVEAGRQILVQAKQDLQQLEETALSGDPLQVRDARDFKTKVELFETRLITLETAYARAPIDLESIGIAQSAGLMTLADTISSSQAEFNDIKSALLRLQAVFQIRSIQQLNQMRRELRASLQQYSIQQLEAVAVEAAGSAADAQLANAQLLVQVATALGNISAKVDAVRAQNQTKIATTRALLADAQQSVSVINQSSRS